MAARFRGAGLDPYAFSAERDPRYAYPDEPGEDRVASTGAMMAFRPYVPILKRNGTASINGNGRLTINAIRQAAGWPIVRASTGLPSEYC